MSPRWFDFLYAKFTVVVKLLDIVVLVFFLQELGDISEEVNSTIISKFVLIRSSLALLCSLGVLCSGKTGGTGLAKPVVPIFSRHTQACIYLLILCLCSCFFN